MANPPVSALSAGDEGGREVAEPLCRASDALGDSARRPSDTTAAAGSPECRHSAQRGTPQQAPGQAPATHWLSALYALAPLPYCEQYCWKQVETFDALEQYCERQLAKLWHAGCEKHEPAWLQQLPLMQASHVWLPVLTGVGQPVELPPVPPPAPVPPLPPVPTLPPLPVAPPVPVPVAHCARQALGLPVWQ